MLTLLTAKQTFKHVNCNRRHRRISSVRSPLASIAFMVIVSLAA
jgi:hypothetical protein